MSAAKDQQPTPNVDALDRATADMRTAAAEFRDAAALLRTELAAARNDRAQQANRISELERKVDQRNKAIKLLRVIAGIDPSPAAVVNGSSKEEASDA
jgi:hypothetical protein